VKIWGNPMNKLTALANPGTHPDGDGLFLKVHKRGGASWLLRLQRDGKRQDIGLGSAKLLPLGEARQKACELRKAIKIDRRDVLAERKDEAAARVAFRDAARQYHAENAAGWKSAIYAPRSGAGISDAKAPVEWIAERAFAHQRRDSLARGASGLVGRMGPGFSRQADGLHG